MREPYPHGIPKPQVPFVLDEDIDASMVHPGKFVDLR